MWNCHVSHHLTKIVAIDQDGVIKHYSTSQIRTFVEQSSMIADSITTHNIEDHHEKTYMDADEPE